MLVFYFFGTKPNHQILINLNFLYPFKYSDFYKSYLKNITASPRGIEWDTVDLTKPLDAIFLLKYNRFGNNILQLINAISLCMYLNIKLIFIPDSFWFINCSIQGPIRFAKFFVKKHNRFNILQGHFFYGYDFWKYPSVEYDYFLTPHLQSILSHSKIENQEDLVLHIRTGDVFTRNVPPNYAQPPICFWEKIIEKYPNNSVVLLIQDYKNPMIKILAEKYPNTIIKNISEIEAISEIFFSKNIGISFGTFSSSIIRISNIFQKVYLFGHSLGLLKICNKYKRLKEVYFINESESYKKIMYPWRSLSKQVLFLLNCSCQNLTLYKLGK